MSWPTVEWEELMWAPTTRAASTSMADAIRRPYLAAITPDVAESAVDLAIDVRTMAAEASAAIAAFDAEIGATFAPFTALLLRSESAASSQIEQLTASAKAIVMAEAGDQSRLNASIIASNTAAMTTARRLADDLTGDAIIEMHRALLGGSRPDIVGRWRSQPVWIGGRSASPHGASFVPPSHERVGAAMDDLIRFLNRRDVPAFEQVMIAHAQFETIHPFPDGNGRTGRALIHAALRSLGLAADVTVPISAGLLADTDRYFAALNSYRAGDPNEIVAVAAEATFRALDNGRQLSADVRRAQTRWREAIRDLRSDALAHRLVEDLAAAPLLYSPDVSKRYGVSTPAANRAIVALEERGVLSRANAGRKFRRWVAHDITDALDAFAERAGRRATG